MEPISEEITSHAGRAALSAVAEEIRRERRAAEAQPPERDALGQRFQERRARARAAVNRAHETWIGARWYARSHRALVAVAATGLAVVALASIAVVLSRDRRR